MADGRFPGHMPSKAAARMLLFLSLTGPIDAGVNNNESLIKGVLVLFGRKNMIIVGISATGRKFAPIIFFQSG